MTEEIWNDIRTRIRNLRADMMGQWQGDIEQSVTLMGNVTRMWKLSRPVGEQPAAQIPPGEVSQV